MVAIQHAYYVNSYKARKQRYSSYQAQLLIGYNDLINEFTNSCALTCICILYYIAILYIYNIYICLQC